MDWLKNALGLKPSKDKFVEIAKRAITTNTGQNDLVYDPEEFCLTVRDKDGSFKQKYFLHNAFSDYCSAPGNSRNAVLEAYFGGFEEMPETLDEIRDAILPRIQARSFYEDTALRLTVERLKDPTAAMKGLAIPYVPVADHFGISLVYDSPRSVAHLGAEKYETWNTSIDALKATAIANLGRLTDRPFKEIAAGVYMPDYQDSHDASRILLRDRMAECRVEGRCIAMIASRDLLIITGENDHRGQSAMLKVAEESMKNPRRMLMIPLVFADGKWTEWEVPKDHPEFDKFLYLKAVGYTDIYSSQKELLDSLHNLEGQEVFVATYVALKQKQTGHVTSQAAWTEGVHALLPKVENISFVRVSGNQGNVECTVPWDMCVQVLGDAMKPMNMYPQRFEVTIFPNAAQMAGLKKAAI